MCVEEGGEFCVDYGLVVGDEYVDCYGVFLLGVGVGVGVVIVVVGLGLRGSMVLMIYLFLGEGLVVRFLLRIFECLCMLWSL